MKSQKAFTLVEIVVITAILFTNALFLPTVSKDNAAKARDAARKADLNQASIMLEMYFADNGKYPGIDVDNTKGGVVCLNEIGEKMKVYLSPMPKDPLKDYVNNACGLKCNGVIYAVDDKFNGYNLIVKLESKTPTGNADLTLVDEEKECYGSPFPKINTSSKTGDYQVISLNSVD